MPRMTPEMVAALDPETLADLKKRAAEWKKADEQEHFIDMTMIRVYAVLIRSDYPDQYPLEGGLLTLARVARQAAEILWAARERKD